MPDLARHTSSSYMLYGTSIDDMSSLTTIWYLLFCSVQYEGLFVQCNVRSLAAVLCSTDCFSLCKAINMPLYLYQYRCRTSGKTTLWYMFNSLYNVSVWNLQLFWVYRMPWLCSATGFGQGPGFLLSRILAYSEIVIYFFVFMTNSSRNFYKWYILFASMMIIYAIMQWGLGTEMTDITQGIQDNTRAWKSTAARSCSHIPHNNKMTKMKDTATKIQGYKSCLKNTDQIVLFDHARCGRVTWPSGHVDRERKTNSISFAVIHWQNMAFVLQNAR